MSDYLATGVICPYFIRIESQTCHITCESVLPGSSIKNHFLNGEALRGQRKKYCAGSYQNCPWYKIVNSKFEE